MVELPTGTVTFLFTDIEGSTRRWEEHPEAMKASVARHEELLRSAVTAAGGEVVKTMGDGMLAVFADAHGALSAAAGAQRALVREDWGGSGPLKVRMGVHTGVAEARGGDYYGTPVNRAARLMAIAHGGQVLVSQATAILARDGLAADVELRDLGEHRLRDVARSERVFQLVAPGLDAEFPVLRAQEERANNLPVQLTSFVGREPETRSVLSLLRQPDIRLVTLTGAGGTGKTRLAIRVAKALLPEFADGAVFVPLAPVADVGVVSDAVGQALGIGEGAGPVPEAVVADHLRPRQVLLLLDNFEHLLTGAPLVARLLASCPRVKVLATSRAALRVSGEQEFPVAPLAVPDVDDLPPADALAQCPSVALFVERATRVLPGFAITPENRAAVASICVRLDGLPLALELAAARVKVLPPPVLLARLAEPRGAPLDLLSGGPQDVPARQRTLWATIAWSYDLLTPPEQQLFRRLAVFVGGCTLDAAEAVCRGMPGAETAAEAPVEPGIDVVDGLGSLLEKSLLRQDSESDAEARFLMLDTIREFAGEQLAATDEAAAVRAHHARYFLDVVERSGPVLLGPKAHRLALVAEQDNIRTALRWLVESG